jgi:3-hydroxy-9,10-secoandrosta-1,3,5(10)-triene-9,17-dione monooxygenase reductase component
VKVAVDWISAKPRLVEARDFRRFHVEVVGATETSEARERLAALLEAERVGSLGDDVVQVSLEWLRSAGPATDPEWLLGLRGMLDYAHRNGWVDDDRGAVAAHVNWVAEPDPMSEAVFRSVLGHFASGVVVVAGVTRDRPVGFTCQSFSAVSVDPPIVLICPSLASTTWPLIRETQQFSISVLAAGQGELCRRFAEAAPDRFDGVSWRPGAVTGAPLIEGAIAWLECRLTGELPVGDHYVVPADVLAMGADGGDPLVFFRGGLAPTSSATPAA